VARHFLRDIVNTICHSAFDKWRDVIRRQDDARAKPEEGLAEKERTRRSHPLFFKPNEYAKHSRNSAKGTKKRAKETFPALDSFYGPMPFLDHTENGSNRFDSVGLQLRPLCHYRSAFGCALLRSAFTRIRLDPPCPFASSAASAKNTPF
jgi:hypothetical protein